MEDTDADKPRRILDPMERLSEILFGLIMAMTFTTAFGILDGGKSDVQVMLAAAIGANLAWGFIDAIMYLMNTLAERGRLNRVLRAIKTSPNPARAGHILASAMPSGVAKVLSMTTLNEAAQALRRLPGPSAAPKIMLADLQGAFGVFLLVVIATFPLVIPFVFIEQPKLAVRVSDVIGITMLFIIGRSYGRIAGYPEYRMAAIMVLIGTSLVILAVMLGG